MPSGPLPTSARKFAGAAAARGLAVTVHEMAASTRTAEEAAAACGVAVGQIVKSLVFTGAASGRPYLLLVSGANRVDEQAVAAQLGEALTRPDAARVRALTGYAIGGIPPFGHDATLPTYMDRDLLAFGVVWAAAGTPRAVFPVDPARLRDAIGAKVIAMC
jgi:prolyl-tRNA editing enzyme YbaK/EbsC (Cys-tRNA(Pro) deacylase)